MFPTEFPPNFLQIGRLMFLCLFLTFSTVLGSRISGTIEAPGSQDSFSRSRTLIRSLLDCINEELTANVDYDNMPRNVKASQKDCFKRSLLTELLDVVNQANAMEDSKIASLLKGNEDFNNETRERFKSLESNVIQSSTLMTTIHKKVTEDLKRLQRLEYYSFQHFKTVYNMSSLYPIIPLITQVGGLEGHPRNCEEIQAGGTNESGVYTIFPFDAAADVGVEVFCDLVTDGGGWTVFQRRGPPLPIKVDFERTWNEFVNGFGILTDNHWLGLNTISELTNLGNTTLRIELTDWNDDVRLAKYSSFAVANGSEQYKYTVSGYSGDAGDSFSNDNGRSFTTSDRDNDEHVENNCAQDMHGAWWFGACHQSHLNGIYIENGWDVAHAQGIQWYHWHGDWYSLKRSEMKVRSRNFKSQ